MKKLILGILSLSTIVALIIWLWTLQPQGKNVLPATNENAQDLKSQDSQSPYEPKDGSVLKTAGIKLHGKTQAGNFSVVTQDKSSEIIKANSDGNYQADLQLQKGLNLVKITTITGDLSRSEESTLTYYFDAQTQATNVYAGSVKTIFDTLITLATTGGEKPVRAGKSTTIIVPKEEDEEGSASAPLKQIRIGDYAIALGNPSPEDSESPLVNKITILRDNKPTIDTQVAIVKTLNTVKANALTVKSKDKTLDLTLNKDTNIFQDGKEIKATEIQKDKNAIVVYHAQEDDNLADVIYILP